MTVKRLNLRKLETSFDCADIGYPGIKVYYILNPDRLEYEEPKRPKAHEEFSVVALAHVLDRIEVPGVYDPGDGTPTIQYTDDGEDLVMRVDTPQDLVELVEMSGDGFDWAIIGHTSRRYWAERREREGTARKN